MQFFKDCCRFNLDLFNLFLTNFAKSDGLKYLIFIRKIISFVLSNLYYFIVNFYVVCTNLNYNKKFKEILATAKWNKCLANKKRKK